MGEEGGGGVCRWLVGTEHLNTLIRLDLQVHGLLTSDFMVDFMLQLLTCVVIINFSN